MMERLTEKWQFERVFREGKKVLNDVFVIYIAPNGLGINRLGIAATKKLGKAVRRNRVKRLIRESYRALEEKLKKGYDIVVVGRSPAVRMKCQQTLAAMSELFKRAKIVEDGDEGVAR